MLGLFGASELLESGHRAADNNEGATGDGEFVLNHREEIAEGEQANARSLSIGFMRNHPSVHGLIGA